MAMVITWFTDRLFNKRPKADDEMAPSLPGTSMTREALPATPASRKRSASSCLDTRPIAASKATRKGAHPAHPTRKSTHPVYGDDSSRTMDETSEMMDNVVHSYSDAAEDEGPCTSASILRTPSQSASRPKPDRRKSGREMSTESNVSQVSLIGSTKKKIFYTINDLNTNRPAERFRTDILSQIRSGDYEFAPPVGDCSLVHCGVIRLTDRWREEWNHGVQVPLHPKNLPHFEIRPCDIPHYSSGPFRLTRDKYLLSKSAPYEKGDTHIVHAPPPLRIYQGDRLDELWLERLNREHAANRLPVLELTTMLNLMNEFEIQCYQNIHRILLSSLVSPSSTNTSFVDEQALCEVCHEEHFDDETDGMVFCDSCSQCLHFSCYGIPLDKAPQKEEPWECDMCASVGFTRHDRLKCALCPNSGGQMQKVEGTDKWAHVSCAIWIQELEFGESKSNGRQVIKSLEPTEDWRWTLKCSICDLRMGACIQCHYKGCAVSFHVSCAQRSGGFEFGHEETPIKKNEIEPKVIYTAYCKRHTLVRGKERGGGTSGRNHTVEQQSEDESDERSEHLRGLERAFYLHVKFEEAAKNLSVSQLHASDVYEYWKQKRSEREGKPLIANADLEIKVDTDAPLLTLECKSGEPDGQIVLRASDDVQHQLTPFQLKCWRFQKHVFQQADRGRLVVDMVLKRERQKMDLIKNSHDIFRKLVDFEESTRGLQVSSRVIDSIVDPLRRDFTPEEMAETERIAERMMKWQPTASTPPKRRSIGGGESVGASLASPAKENGHVKRRRISMDGEGGGRGRTPSIPINKSIPRRSIPTSDQLASFDFHEDDMTSSHPSPLSRRSTSKITPSSRILRFQNPPDDPPTVPAPSHVATSSESPSKLRERREVKYF